MNKKPLARSIAPLLVAAAFFPGALAAEQVGKSPVKIFILAGQSNMVGMGEISPVTTPGTLEYIVANDPAYAFMGDGAGGFQVLDDVWIRYNDEGGGLTAGYGGSADMVGPELGFGHAVGDLYEEQVLLIKYARGGRSLGNDFLPPSSGPYPEPMSDGDPGYHYQQILEMVSDVTANLATYFPDYDGAGYEIVGFAWHQGWNDRVSSEFSAAYETNMANFINDIRSDLALPNLPFVIATSAMDFDFRYTQVELAQLAMADAAKYPEFVGNVSVIDARQAYQGLTFWQLVSESPRSEGFHWNRNAKSYTNLGLAMADAISLMVPARGPYRLEASGDAAGVSLSWSEGEETPTALQVLRNGTEIAASAAFDPPVFLDAGAEPGLIEYQLNFTMPGDPIAPLTLTYDAGITGLEAYRFRNDVKLVWDNNLDYTAIEVRRDGVLIEPALDGSATSYLDTTPPESGTAVYSVVPTNGTATPTQTSINLDGLSPGNAYIYEPFADPDPTLVENVSGAGLESRWFGALNVTEGSMSFGALPTSGNQAFNAGGNASAGVLIRPELADAGLLDDGAELWFSFLANNTDHVNTAVFFHLGTDRSDFFGGMPEGGEGIGVNINRGSGPQAATWAPSRSAASTSGSIESNTTALIVGKITWGADPTSPDTIEIYLPATDLILPDSPVSTQSAVLDQSIFNTVSFGGKFDGAPQIDEIRFAANYDDVVALDQIMDDTTPPSPNPMTWASPPAADGDNSITMVATTASDDSGVEYYFTETTGKPGGSDSGWQDSPSYTDIGLDAETTYAYTVKARDKSFNQNETDPSSPPAEVTTDAPDTAAPPTPGFAVAPTAVSPFEITMTATPVTDPSGVEYYFTETSGNFGGSDSGWQDSNTYTDSGLNPETTYTYNVTARDKSSNQNTSAPSTDASATTLALPSGPGGALIYEPFAQGTGSLSGTETGFGLAGTWTTNQAFNVVAPLANYGILGNEGNRVDIPNNNGAWAQASTTALADAGLLSNGATLWFSYVFQKTAGGGSNEHAGFAFGTDGVRPGASGLNMDNSGSGLGVYSRNLGLTASSWSDGSRSGGGSVNLDDYSTPTLVIGRIVWGATDTDNETLTIWSRALNDIETEPTTGGATRTVGPLTQAAFDTISFGQRNSGGTQTYDEIRFGATYGHVIGQGSVISRDYDDWAALFPGIDLTDPDADFNGDGLTNNEKRIWGLDPTDHSAVNPISVPLDAFTGTLTYTRRNPSLTGISYGYQWSDTLAEGDWTTFTPALETPSGGSPVESVEITLDDALLELPKIFIRVMAIEP